MSRRRAASGRGAGSRRGAASGRGTASKRGAVPGRGTASRRAVTDEHRRLEPLFSEARAALELRGATVARRALEALAAALAVHFEQEDTLYYPPVASLRPAYADRVRAFAAAHVGFLAQLAEIESRAREPSRANARRRFASFALAFAAHEAAEEELLRSMEAEVREAC